MSVKDIQNSIYNVSDFYNTTQLGQGTGYVNGFTSGHTSGYVSGYAYKPFRVPVKEFSYKPQEQKQESNLFVANYNDPSQINSIADVIYSRKGIINASLELLKNTWNPILHKNEKGEWDPQFVLAAVNSLVNVGETLDIFANPVKGLFQEGFTGLKKATIGDSSGRYNYDWDIDPEHKWDGLINLGLEFISDPVNWFTFGTSTAIKQSGKAFSKTLLEDGTNSLAKQIMKSAKVAGKQYSIDAAQKTAKEAIIDASKQTFKEFSKVSAKELGEETAEAFIKRSFVNNVKKFVANKHGLELVTDVATSRLGLQVNKNLNKASINIVKSLGAINKGAEFVDKAIFQTAMSNVGVYPLYKVASKIPHLSNISKKITDKALTSVLTSPVAYGVRDAYTTVKLMVKKLDADTSLQDLLKASDSGTITQTDLTNILSMKVNKHIDVLKVAIRDSKAKDITDVAKVIDDTIYKETGYKTLKEYMDSINTLAGQCDHAFEWTIYKMKKFTDDVLSLDKHEKIKQINSNIKRSIEALNIKPKTLDVSVGTTKKETDTILKAIDTLSTLKVKDFETPDNVGRVGAAKHGAMFDKLIELTKKINTKKDLNLVEEEVLRYIDDVKALQIYYDEDIFTSVKIRFMDAIHEATENIKNIDNNVVRFQLTANHVYDFITERSLLGETNAEIKESVKQLLIKKIPQNTADIKAATEELYKLISDGIDAIPEELFRHSEEGINYLLQQHIPLASTLNPKTKKEIVAPAFSKIFNAATTEQKKLKEGIVDTHTIQHVLNWFNPEQGINLMAQANAAAQNTISLLNKLADLDGIQLKDDVFSDYLAETINPITYSDEIVSLLEAIGCDDTENINLFKEVINYIHNNYKVDITAFNSFGKIVGEKPDTAMAEAYKTQFIKNNIEEALLTLEEIADNFTNNKSIADIDYNTFEKAYNAIVGEPAVFNSLPIEVQDYLNLIQPKSLLKREVNINAGGKVYVAKCEQLQNIAMYLGDTEFMDTMFGIASRTSPLGQQLESMANLNPNTDYGADLVEYAQALLTLADNFEVYCNTFLRISELAKDGTFTQKELNAIQSTLQNPQVALANISDVIQNSEEFFENIFKRVENYYSYAYVYNQSLSVESIIARNSVYKTKYNIEKELHDADADARLEYIIAHEEAEIKPAIEALEKEGYIPIAFDIETSGTDLKYDKLLEIGTYNSSGESNLYRFKFATEAEALTAIPQSSVLNKTASDYQTYLRRYVAEPGEHIKTEKEYYTDVINDILKNGDKIVLITHYGDTFDIPFIIERFKQAGVDPALIERFSNIKFFDNLNVLREAKGYIVLSSEKKKIITDILKEHMDSLKLKTSSNKFFDAGIKDFRINLREQIKTISDYDLNKTGATLAEDKARLSYLEALQDLQKKFLSIAQVTAKANRELPLIMQNTISNLPNMAEDLKAFFNVAGIDAEQFFENLGTEPTISKLFYNNDNILNFLGYRLVADLDIVNDWFTFKDGNALQDIALVERYTKEGNILDKIMVKARSLEVLKHKEYVAQLREYAHTLQNLIPDDKVMWHRMFRDNVNLDTLPPTALYAVTVRMHGIVKPSLPADVVQQFSDIFHLLEGDIKTADHVIAYDLAVNRISQYTDIEDAITASEITKGANKLYTSNRQYTASALRRTQRFVSKVRDKLLKMDYKEKRLYTKKARDLLNNVCVTQTAGIISKDPEQMFEYMLNNRAPIMFYTMNDDITLFSLTQELLNKKAEYKAFGININVEDNIVLINFDKSVKFDYYVDDLGFHATTDTVDNIIDFSKNNALDFSEYGEDAAEIDAIYKQMAEISNGMSIGHLGNNVSKEQLEEYLSALPKALTKDLDVEAVTKATIFSRYTYDTMNIGSLASRQTYNQYIPSDLTKLMTNYNMKIVESANKKNLMLDYWFNKDMSVSQMVNKFGEDAVKNMLTKHDEYKVIILAQDKKLAEKGKGFHKQGYKVVELDTTKKQLWNIAKDETQGAIIVPNYMYADMYDALNSSLLYDNPVYKLAHQYNYKLKLGLITSVGNVYRNIIDGQLKNMLETRSVLKTLKNNYIASKDMKAYNKAVQEILSLSEIDYNKLKSVGIDPADFAEKYINNRFEAEKLVQQYYASLKDVMKMDQASYFLQSNKELYFNSICKSGMDKDTFDTLHAILTDSGTLGGAEVWMNYTKRLHDLKQKKFVIDYEKGLIGDKMIEKPANVIQRVDASAQALFNLLMKPAQYLDRVNRVSEYLTLIDTGFVNPTAALGKITRTHFDFDVKTETELLAELTIPFYAFFKHNILYWAKACEQNPWAAKIFADYIEQMYDEKDIGDVSDFERRNNTSLMLNKLAGNIILNKAEAKDVTHETRYDKYGRPYTVKRTKLKDPVTLKMNLPFMEVYQACSNPIGYFASSANPIITLILQSWIGNNPDAPEALANLLDVYRPYDIDEGGRAKLQGWMLLPGIGPIMQKWGPDGYAKKQYENTGFLGSLIIPSLFGRLNKFNKAEVESHDARSSLPYRRTMSLKQFQFINKYGTNLNFSKQSYTPKKRNNKKTYKKATNYYKKYYGSYTYSNKLYPTNYVKHYSDSYVKHNWDTYKRAYPQRIVKRAPSTFYKRLYFPNGMAKVQRLGLPRKVKNPNYVIRNLFSYTR